MTNHLLLLIVIEVTSIVAFTHLQSTTVFCLGHQILRLEKEEVIYVHLLHVLAFSYLLSFKYGARICLLVFLSVLLARLALRLILIAIRVFVVDEGLDHRHGDICLFIIFVLFRVSLLLQVILLVKTLLYNLVREVIKLFLVDITPDLLLLLFLLILLSLLALHVLDLLVLFVVHVARLVVKVVKVFEGHKGRRRLYLVVHLKVCGDSSLLNLKRIIVALTIYDIGDHFRFEAKPRIDQTINCVLSIKIVDGNTAGLPNSMRPVLGLYHNARSPVHFGEYNALCRRQSDTLT